MMLYQDLKSNLSSTVHGGKATHLSVLSKNGFRVPTAFVLSKDVYLNYLANPAETLKQLILETESVLQQIDSKFIMVRSSAIGEDGASSSFAGLLESYQSPSSTAEVVDFIIKCWDSHKSQRVIDYQEKTGTTLGGMAVMVQRMIEPIWAGVGFTCSPHNEDYMLIEYVEGHCEKLVQGEVDPHKLTVLRKQETVDASGLQFQELISKMKGIEAFFEFPQDIEWAMDAEGLWIIQSRPITTFNRKNLWSNTNVNENYPEKISPLLYSIAKESYYHFFQNLALTLKAVPNTHEIQYQLRNVVGLWGEKLYYNMTSIHHVIDQTPFAGMMKKSFDDFVGHQNEKHEGSKKKLQRTLTFSFYAVLSLFKLPKYVRSLEKEVDEFASSVDRAFTQTELRQGYSHFFHLRFNRWFQANFADFFAMIFHGLLGKLTGMLDKKDGENWQNSLIQGIPGLVSKKPVEEMWTIKQIINSSTEFQELFKNTPAQIVSELSQDRYKVLHFAIQKYLREWGYRCSGELMLTMDNLYERPESFIVLMKSYLETESRDPKLMFEQETLKYDETQRRILKTLTIGLLKNPIKNFVLLLIFPVSWNLARYSIACRERVRLKQALMYFKFKQVCVRLGKIFEKQDLILEANDIFFLDYQQIDQILSEDEVCHISLKKTLADRKALWDKAGVFPDQFHSYGLNNPNIDKVSTQLTDGSNTLKGLPASNGIIQGRAMVLKDIHEAHKLMKGDILITRQTDPGWISVFPLISGIVIERGGMLSHGAIVAREFGISAVVGVENATSLIKDGDMISLNGNTGQVCLL